MDDRRRGTSYTGFTRAVASGFGEAVRDFKELAILTAILAAVVFCVCAIAWMAAEPRGFVEAVARVADGLWAVMLSIGL